MSFVTSGLSSLAAQAIYHHALKRRNPMVKHRLPPRTKSGQFRKRKKAKRK
jgi:hypothetical protein